MKAHQLHDTQVVPCIKLVYPHKDQRRELVQDFEEWCDRVLAYNGPARLSDLIHHIIKQVRIYLDEGKGVSDTSFTSVTISKEPSKTGSANPKVRHFKQLETDGKSEMKSFETVMNMIVYKTGETMRMNHTRNVVDEVTKQEKKFCKSVQELMTVVISKFENEKAYPKPKALECFENEHYKLLKDLQKHCDKHRKSLNTLSYTLGCLKPYCTSGVGVGLNDEVPPDCAIQLLDKAIDNALSHTLNGLPESKAKIALLLKKNKRTASGRGPIRTDPPTTKKASPQDAVKKSSRVG
jgi:hypothetical protein